LGGFGLELLEMKIPVLEGMIKRRMLINFRVDAAVMQKFLPAPFRPKLHKGYAIAGICLIRLEHIRPAGLPAFLGFSSENAAHRIAVEWDDPSGEQKEGVFIPRRDTASRLNHLTGGRIFSGEHHLAKFHVVDDGTNVDFTMESCDKAVSVQVRGFNSDVLPPSSCFASLAESSHFFECGSLGYSVTCNPHRLDGLRLKTLDWRVCALAVEQVQSSFFANTTCFPTGSAEFDHALIMRDIPHEWHQAADMTTKTEPEYKP
jgi:Uncharacterized conserved protein (COG2071)